MPQLTPLEQGLADVEFQADLSRSPSHGPISRLGKENTREGGAKVQLTPLSNPAFHIAGQGAADRINDTDPGTSKAQVGDIYISPDFTSTAVWNHEFRHSGLQVLRDRVERGEITVESVRDRFGEDGVDVVRSMLLSKGDSEEQIAEIFDDPNESASRTMSMSETIQQEGMSPERAELFRRVLTDLAIDALEDQGIPVDSERRAQARSFLKTMTGVTDE